MSNTRAKTERSKAKDKRQSAAPERPVSKIKRKDKSKPYEVWIRSLRMPFFNDWYRSGRYTNLETAKEVVENDKRKYGVLDNEYKIVYRDKNETYIIESSHK